ncbi:acylglycerol kinase, mitochondrial-like [Tubulanus polymorphus]|uniref:acylglycerol kinase, mitochondrial-like n=1 Tax=Tubulanus polymorphus TaxID=672921 RepID=UPI003DA499B3
MASKVVNGLKTIRNNWKKTVFAAGLSLWGYNWYQGRSADAELRRQYCLEAKSYGDVGLGRSQRPTKVTVFLNPAAKDGKARKLFEKNVFPLLSLAGYEVAVIKTEYEGQAKKYMEAIEKEDCDIVLVAGGDGTLQEVITGLLRRKDLDDKPLYKTLPIGILPVGETNNFASLLFGYHRSKEHVKFLVESTMAVIKGATKLVDVLHVQGDDEKSVYALSGLEWGKYKETEEYYKGIWFLGPIRRRWAYIKHAVFSREWPLEVVADVTYSNPCSGCNKCRQPPEWKWWHILSKPRYEDFSKVVNEDCGVEYSSKINGLQFTAKSSNFDPQNVAKAIETEVHPTLSRTAFIQQGWKKIEKKPYESCGTESKQRVGKLSIQPEVKQEAEEWFHIDGEQFEAKPIQISVLRDKLHFFCPPQPVGS